MKATRFRCPLHPGSALAEEKGATPTKSAARRSYPSKDPRIPGDAERRRDALAGIDDRVGDVAVAVLISSKFTGR
jgi:hypothetical protein